MSRVSAPSGRLGRSHPRLPQFVPVKSFEELWDELAAKAAAATPGSGTVSLLAQGVHAVGKKVVEEAAEAWMAAEHEDADRAAEEIAQLIYHAQVLMLAKGLELKDVYRHL
jgi:phosphoribosyl-ATP pyrophosphohydrolase